NPWDNAPIESFHALIKREWLSRIKFRNINEVRRAVFEYIEIFYNNQRIHGSINYLSPKQFEEMYYKSKQLLLYV
ncbi:MAG: IS3 family transposase, partial [Erysipelothrix sp.]|nr:IS3 family transposase [Erysipelothrix sp.]